MTETPFVYLNYAQIESGAIEGVLLSQEYV